jgi:hypothetical protein
METLSYCTSLAISKMHKMDDDHSAFVCPKCAEQIEPVADGASLNCYRCGHRIDTPAQLAFLRGQAAYYSGSFGLTQRKRDKKRPDSSAEDGATVRQYMLAYSALQEAFQGELAESQRRAGIRMMAAVSQEFQQKTLISPLESGYWVALLMEVRVEEDLAEVRAKLADSQANNLAEHLARFRLWLKNRRLEAQLKQLDQKIRLIELGIEFATPPRARKTILR